MSEEQRSWIPPFIEVYERLRELVRRDGLGPGELLPVEAVLAGELSVARELVREALLLLEGGRAPVAGPRAPMAGG